MRPRNISARNGLLRRRAFVGLCVIAHLLSTIGFPLPRLDGIEQSSDRFPCQHHRCGCRSAEQCWRSCCCMTTQQKLAWARAHGVTPPNYVLARGELTDKPATSTTCCSDANRQVAACCSASKAGAVPGCCSDSTRHSENGGQQHKSDSPIVWVIGAHAQKCQGIATWWITTGAVTPPPARVLLPTDHAPPRWSVHGWDCLWQSISPQPAVPPPRAA